MRPRKKQTHHPDTLSAFCHELGSLLRRGHSLSECFAAMAGGAASPAEERLYLGLLGGVRQGTLTSAMTDSGAFPPYMLMLIARGEEAGRTEETLGTLCTYFERERTANHSLHGHAVYPAVMAALSVGILIVAGGFVLPVFADQFAALGLTFSPFAHWAMIAGRWLSGLAGVALTAAVFAGVLLWITLQNSSLPAFQRTMLGQRIAAGRFTAALAMFCRGGLDDNAALIQTEALIQHPFTQQAAVRMHKALDKGTGLPAALAESGLVIGISLDRLRAEGRAPFLLDEAAARMAADTAARMTRLLVLLEPMLVLALSGAAGAILLSVMLPLLGGLTAMG